MISSRSKGVNNKTYPIEIMDYIKDLIYKNPFLSRLDVITNIENKFNIRFKFRDIKNIYKYLKLTRKKVRELVVKNETYLNELTIKRNNFIYSIKDIDINKIISIDETSFNRKINNNKGISRKGENIYVPIDSLYTKNITLILAITNTNIIHNEIYENNVNGNMFYPED